MPLLVAVLLVAVALAVVVVTRHSSLYLSPPEKYDYVGRLLKPGDEPSEYTDEEDIKDHLKHE